MNKNLRIGLILLFSTMIWFVAINIYMQSIGLGPLGQLLICKEGFVPDLGNGKCVTAEVLNLQKFWENREIPLFFSFSVIYFWAVLGLIRKRSVKKPLALLLSFLFWEMAISMHIGRMVEFSTSVFILYVTGFVVYWVLLYMLFLKGKAKK